MRMTLFLQDKLNKGSDQSLICHLSFLHRVSCKSNTLYTLFKSSKVETRICVAQVMHEGDQSKILADEQHGIFAMGVWGMHVCIEYRV